MRPVIVLCSLVLLVSCGGSPASPTYPNVAGIWSGTMQTANLGMPAIQLTVTQTNQVVRASWTADSDWSGTLIGAMQLSGSFTGTMTISAPNPAGGARCTGTASVGGASSGTVFSMASNGFAGTCAALPEDLTIITRRP